MALGKMLNLGGMENSLPKTTQNPNRFRQAVNVQPTVEGKIIPRSSYETGASQPSNIKRFSLLKDYQNSLFKMAVIDNSGSSEYSYYLDNTLIPKSNYQGDAILGDSDNTSLSVMSFRKNDTLYVFSPLPNSFFKYDGVEVTGCGSSQPRFSCAEYSAAGTDYVKVIQHRIDFDSNEILSETVTFPIAVATNTITIRTDGAATPIVNPSNLGVSPTDLVTANQNTMADLYFVGTATYNAGTQDYSIAVSETNIGDQQIGAYVFLGNNGTISSYWPGLGYRLLALKVKTASPLVLDALDAKVMLSNTFEWKSANVTTGVAGVVTFGFRKIFSVWGSSSATGNFTLRATNPAFPESVISKTFTADTTNMATPTGLSGQLGNLPVNIGPNLGDFYDVNSRKLALNTDYGFGGNFYGMTSYQDQILWWNEDLIFFSDPNLGGSVEQPSAGSFIRVGDSEYGQVVSVCGTQDYLIVSRERKNYYVNGNLATGNYRVQDIAEIEVGAWCNNGTINIKDSVILINSIGVWQISSGGRVSFLSKQIPQNFSTYNGYSNNEVPFFKLNGYSTFPISSPYPSDTGLDIAFDEYREYLIFCQRGTAGTPILVMHTKTGEFYEWVGFETTALRGMAFIRGVLYYGTVDTTTNAAVVKSELSSVTTQNYASVSAPIILTTTWLTAGEPSLEKQVLQIKMFGYVFPNGTNGLSVLHYKDWDATNRITLVNYLPTSTTQYSHIQRLNSDKALSVSVGFQITQTGVTFALESLEMEFNPIQVGMKR